MAKFLNEEKQRYSLYKKESLNFGVRAKQDGVYRNKLRNFCLHLDEAEENLYAGIRDAALNYFCMMDIKWHDGKNEKPSNHLCDSQVCCVNFLFPFADKPEQLKRLLQPVFPDISEMLIVENDQYVAFEWIGRGNYLKEKTGKNGKRTRGANYTSADAMVMFERTDGQRQIVLIEWKYTESYSATSLASSKGGTERTAIYKECYDRGTIDKSKIAYNDLFYNPFYQLLRQQLLANEMERNGELGATIVSLLHISPRTNLDFSKITSPKLRGRGSSPTEIWKDVVAAERFTSISTEDIFGKYAECEDIDAIWWKYLSERYPWVKNS